MKIKKKYRLKKKFKNFLIFYTFICISFISSYTFSRYITTTSSSSNISIAKFKVKVNDIDIIEGIPFKLNLSPNANTYNDKIVPDSNGYFEIEINPANTEVSLEYDFTFNLENIDSNIKLSNWVINDEIENAQEVVNNEVKGNLLLPNSNYGFTESDKINIKVYWSWEDEIDIVNPVFDNTFIIVTATVRQKIN